MDVVFLLDESDAVCHSDPSAVAGAFSILTCNNFKDMQGFVVDLIKYFDITAVKVALLKFADQATVVYALDKYVGMVAVRMGFRGAVGIH